jgi:sulfur-oxidizing protein SoxY
MHLEIVDRRDFLVGAAAAATLLLVMAGPGTAQDRPQALEEALKKIMGDAKPVDGKITLDLPEIAENGNTVPFTMSVDSPMTDVNYVKAMHIFAAGNPQADVASFSFTPMSGKAAASSRMRLAKTQDVVAIAELNDGRFLLGKRTVKVTIGGCGG